MFVFFLLIIGAIVAALWAGKQTTGGSATETPLDIARRRYARGEISKDEFDRLKEDLR